MDNVPEETHVVFSHEMPFGQQSSPAPISKAKTDGEKSCNRGESSSDKRSRIRCRY